MKITIITTALFLLYGGFITIFDNSSFIGQSNLYLFGYFAYINFFVLLYPFFILYKQRDRLRDIHFYLGWKLLFIAIVILEGLLFDMPHSGFLGMAIVETLNSMVSQVGSWLFLMITLFLALFFVLEEKGFDGFSADGLGMKKDTRTSSNKEKPLIGKQYERFIQWFKSLIENPFVSASLQEEMMPSVNRQTPHSTPQPTTQAPKRYAPPPKQPTPQPIEEEEAEPEIAYTPRQKSKPQPTTQAPKRYAPPPKQPTPQPIEEEEAEPEIAYTPRPKSKPQPTTQAPKRYAPPPKQPTPQPIEEEEEAESEIAYTPRPKSKPQPTTQASNDDPILEEILAVEPKEPFVEAQSIEPSPEPLAPMSPKSDDEPLEKAVYRDTLVDELEENAKFLETIDQGSIELPQHFELPSLEFLQKAPKITKKVDEEEIDQKIEEILSKLRQFRVEGDVVRTYSGPLVTTFEFKPAPNVKVSKILNLQDDLAMALSAETIRIQAPIPGRNVVGIEIPNANIDTIYLRDILESDLFQNSSSPLTVALGKDIVGKPFITDIKKLPHLLIAGTTGSGKSVGINAMILSLLYRNDPDNLKLMLIDPKMLEFSMYNDIPHLITPVIIEPAKAIAALANMVAEMERRYLLMAEARTKNIENYNEKVTDEDSAEPFPFIVIVIDELADLMMNGGKEVELSIARLAQKSRACGIHLIVATQRPSVDVVTGLIKANLPSRLSYRVGSKIDSKVILDAMGADSLLGRGDGLFTPPGTTGLVRIHAPWNTEDEIDEIVGFLKAQRLPEYDESYLVVGGASAKDNTEDEIVLDPLYEDAKHIVLSDNKTSISYLQRKLQIGYNRSANIIEQLEAKGVLSEPNAKGNREIL